MKYWLEKNKLELDSLGRLKKYTDFRGKEAEERKSSVQNPGKSR